jgi:hypothetical protein
MDLGAINQTRWRALQELLARAAARPVTAPAKAAFLSVKADGIIRQNPQYTSYSVTALVSTLLLYLVVEDVVLPDPRDPTGRATLTVSEARASGQDGLPMPYTSPLTGLPAPFPLERLAYEVLFARPSLAYKWPR